jgi:hypothetical protein
VGRIDLPRRLLLACVLLPLVGVALILILATSQPRPAPVLHIRVSSLCVVGVNITPAPCPVETWIDEHSGAVRVKQTYHSATMDQIYLPARKGWRVVSRISPASGSGGIWSRPSATTLPLPYPRSLATLRTALRGLEKSTPSLQRTIARGRPALAIMVPEGDLNLPWPLDTATTVYVDRISGLPLRLMDQNGEAIDVQVEAETTADLPAGFLSLPGQHGTFLDTLLDYMRRLHL